MKNISDKPDKQKNSMSSALSSDDIKLPDLVNTKNPECVLEEIKIIVSMIFSEFDFDTFESIYIDTIKLYSGEYPGYRKCTTDYHDLTHTIDALLALARLIHGYCAGNGCLSEKSVLLGLVSALMHDTGYIQTIEDISGTGAKYTLTHVSRSIDFMEKYLTEYNFSKEDIGFCRNCIRCTENIDELNKINFSSHEEEILGKMLGIADLISQMAARNYLEKLVLLYIEFTEGNVNDFENELDLLKKTVVFLDKTMKRFSEDLENLNKYMIFHFRIRWNINNDLYLKSIEKNASYLKKILSENAEAFHKYLRRDGILKSLYEKDLLKKTM